MPETELVSLVSVLSLTTALPLSLSSQELVKQEASDSIRLAFSEMQPILHITDQHVCFPHNLERLHFRCMGFNWKSCPVEAKCFFLSFFLSFFLVNTRALETQYALSLTCYGNF